jgi:hypothetical protein
VSVTVAQFGRPLLPVPLLWSLARLLPLSALDSLPYRRVLRWAIDSEVLAFRASTFACWSSFTIDVEGSLVGGAGCTIAIEGEDGGERVEGERVDR